MKKLILLASAIMLMVSCGKQFVDNPVSTPSNGEAVTLTAVFPQFVSGTKAGVDDTGTFSWSYGDEADVIAVKYVNGENVEWVDFVCQDADGNFQGTPTSGYTLATDEVIAYYPSTYRGTPSNYSGTAADAAKSFQMKATLGDGSLVFTHDNALLKIIVNDIPSIATSLVVGSSTVTLSEGGDLTVYVPVLPAAEAVLSVSVKYGDTPLVSKFTSKSVAILAGTIYTTIPTLSAAPEGVYLKSNMTDWDESATAPMATEDGAIYTLDLQSVGDQYAKVYVKYPTGTWIKMGTGTGSDSETPSSTDLVVDDAKSVHITDLGSYTFTYNNTTGNFTIVPTGNPFNLYIRGNLNSWAYDDAYQLTSWKDGEIYYYVGRFSGEQKLYYNHFDNSQLAASSKGSSGTLVKETGSSAVLNVDGENIYYEVINLKNMSFKIQYVTDSSNSGAVSAFGMRGSQDGWDNKIAFTSPATNTWVLVKEMYKDSEFLFWDNNTEEYGKDNNWASNDYIEATGSDNYKVKTSGVYLFVIHLDDWKYYCEYLEPIAGT